MDILYECNQGTNVNRVIPPGIKRIKKRKWRNQIEKWKKNKKNMRNMEMRINNDITISEVEIEKENKLDLKIEMEYFVESDVDSEI